jgi:hypothetical protein
MFPRDIPISKITRDPIRDGHFRCRIGFLWRDKDCWWGLAPVLTAEWTDDGGDFSQKFDDARNRITDEKKLLQMMADDMYARVEKNVFPFFQQLIKEDGAGR